MRTALRVLCNLIVLEVVIQAAAIAWAFFGLSKFIDDGAVVDKATQESGVTFDGVTGFIVHGVNGQFGVPLIGLVLLVVALVSKIPGAVRFAVPLFVMIVVQVLLGLVAHSVPILGALHGLVAIGIAVEAFRGALRFAGDRRPLAAAVA